MSFGSVFKSLRKERGYTQEHMANLLLVTPQAISRWENNTAMPDISLLIPIANVFGVSTDVLLEVNVEANTAHIDDLVQHALFYREPYGSTALEKVSLYESEITKFPDSIPLKKALITILLDEYLHPVGDVVDELHLCRRIASLSEDVIESEKDPSEVSHYQSLVAIYSNKLHNLERAAKLAESADCISSCKEVLLPSALTGREQVEARKDLLFKCADIIITTIYDLLGENAEDLTAEEGKAICSAEGIIASLYGQSVSDHFILSANLYKGVQYDLRHQDVESAKKRIIDIARRHEARNSEPVEISPLLTNEQLEAYHAVNLLRRTVDYDSSVILKRIRQDFPNLDELRNTDACFDKALQILESLKDANEGQEEIDAMRYLSSMLLKEVESRKAAKVSEAQD